MRRHVKTIASRPPSGYETSGVYGPESLRSYFDGIPFNAIGRAGLLTAGRDADVIHAHGINAGLAAVLPGGPPVVTSLHIVVGSSGRTAGSASASSLARMIANRADVRIAVSRGAAVGAKDARIIPPAFEPLAAPVRTRDEVRAEFGIAPDDVVVVCVSRPDRSKQLDRFVRAIDAAECVGLIAGDGPDVAHLTSIATSGRTPVLGQRDDVADLLAASDVFALPSASESYGIAVAEAIAAGLPVVATHTGAIDELVGPAGIVVDPSDETAFIDAVVSVVRDGDLRQRFAVATSGVVRPDRDALLAAVGEVYDEMLGDR